jgi:hypothetical protein
VLIVFGGVYPNQPWGVDPFISPIGVLIVLMGFTLIRVKSIDFSQFPDKFFFSWAIKP